MPSHAPLLVHCSLIVLLVLVFHSATAQRWSGAVASARQGQPRLLHALVDSLAAVDAEATENVPDLRTDHELVPGFREKSFDIKDPYRPIQGVGCYSIELITEGAHPIHCLVLDRSSGREVDGVTVWDRDTVLFTRDTVRLRELDRRYLMDYGAPLEAEQLFCDTVIYGRLCGRAPQAPIMRERMERGILFGRPAYFNTWLTSPMIEVQLYAVEAMSRMEWMGARLDKQQRRCIRSIARKKGVARTCHGCLGDRASIREVFRTIPR